MPNKPRWLLRIPELIEQLNTCSSPTLDRHAVETLFELKRRRAIELMHHFGSRQVGYGFLLDRDSLLDRLRALENSREFRWEQQRVARVSERARELTQAIKLDDREEYHGAELPAGVRLQPGKLVIEFQRIEDLKRCLTEISRALEEHCGAADNR